MAGVTVAKGDFDQAVQRVLPAVSSDRKHPALRCVLLETSERSLRLVATDRARLIVCEIPLSDRSGAGPLRALLAGTDLAGLDTTHAAELTLRVDGGSIHIATGEATSTFQLAEADFPDYERFLAADPEATPLVVDRAAFLDAIEEATDDGPLPLRLTTDRVEVGESPPLSVPAKYEGEELDLLVDPGYLHDAVSSTAGPEVVLEVTGPFKPVVIRSTGDDSYTAVVMPMRQR